MRVLLLHAIAMMIVGCLCTLPTPAGVLKSNYAMKVAHMEGILNGILLLTFAFVARFFVSGLSWWVYRVYAHAAAAGGWFNIFPFIITAYTGDLTHMKGGTFEDLQSIFHGPYRTMCSAMLPLSGLILVPMGIAFYAVYKNEELPAFLPSGPTAKGKAKAK